MRTPIRPLSAVALLGALMAVSAQASPPPGPYFNGFEKNTNGWFNEGGTITREPSGYVSASGYASGIASASGGYHARLGLDPSPDTCQSGSGPHPVYYGPLTNWGGYSSTFPSGGYKTQLDIYLDVTWAASHPDARFDWSSAINDPSGNFRRDFVFNAGTDPDPSPDTCQSGSGPHPVYYGPLTNWGGYSSTFPSGGYKTQLDIYLDVTWAASHPDARFDWSSAINDPSGNFRRDFVFNAGTD